VEKKKKCRSATKKIGDSKKKTKPWRTGEGKGGGEEERKPIDGVTPARRIMGHRGEGGGGHPGRVQGHTEVGKPGDEKMLQPSNLGAKKLAQHERESETGATGKGPRGKR